MRVLPGPTRSNTALAWSPDSRLLAAGGSGDGVMVWDVDAGTPGERVLRAGHGGKFLQFCPRTGRLYVAFQMGGFCHYDSTTGEEHQHHWSRTYHTLLGMAGSDDGRTVVILCQPRFVYSSPPPSPVLLGFAVDDRGAMALSWSRPDDRVWSRLGEQWAFPFALRPGTGELFRPGREPHPGPLGDVMRFEWVEAETDELVGTLRFPLESRAVERWALSPDGQRVAWLSDHTLYLQRLDAPSPLQLPAAEGEYRRGLSFHPSGRVLAFTGSKTVRLLDVETLAEVGAFDWGTGNARAVAFSPDGLRCAVSGERGRGWVTVFDVE